MLLSAYLASSIKHGRLMSSQSAGKPSQRLARLSCQTSTSPFYEKIDDSIQFSYPPLGAALSHLLMLMICFHHTATTCYGLTSRQEILSRRSIRGTCQHLTGTHTTSNAQTPFDTLCYIIMEASIWILMLAVCDHLILSWSTQ